MTPPPTNHEIVGQLADEFLERYRRGERPSISEYVHRCPDCAGEIRDLLPALVVMENVASQADDASLGPVTDGAAADKKELGDFRILREIGRGGMAVVYEAEDTLNARRKSPEKPDAQSPNN